MASRSLIRRDPRMQDLLDFRRDFDDIFNHFLQPFSAERAWGGGSMAWIPPLETYVDRNTFHVRLALPGVKPEEVNIQVQGNQLTITGERRQESRTDDQYLQREFSYGSFERTVMLPEEVQTDHVEANFDNGVLDIAATLSEKVLPRKVEIKSGQKSGQLSERKVEQAGDQRQSGEQRQGGEQRRAA